MPGTIRLKFHFFGKINMHLIIVVTLLLGLIDTTFIDTTIAQAQISGRGRYAHRPYGDYADGSHGGCYGDKRPVTSVPEARKILRDYYADNEASIGKVVEKGYYYEAEILDRHNRVVDRVIVDRRTGRFRSIN
jgi:hypothetical protein